MKFQDRQDAARKLYSHLNQIETGKVAALPNDSVVIARFLADRLNAPFDLIAVEHVKSPETGEIMGAVTHQGVMHLEDSLPPSLSPAFMEWERNRLMVEARRFRRLFHVEDQQESSNSAILVDDGTSDLTGLLAACKHLYRSGIDEVVVALPSASEQVYRELSETADSVEVLFRDSEMDCSELYESGRRLSEEQFRRCVQG